VPKDVHGDLAAWHLGGCSWWRLLFEKIWFYFLFLHVYFSSFFLISYTYSKATAVVVVSCLLIIGIGVCRLAEAAWRGESRKACIWAISDIAWRCGCRHWARHKGRCDVGVARCWVLWRAKWRWGQWNVPWLRGHRRDGVGMHRHFVGYLLIEFDCVVYVGSYSGPLQENHVGAPI